MTDVFRRRFQTGFGHGLKGHAIMVVYVMLFFTPVAGSFDCGDALFCSKYYRYAYAQPHNVDCENGIRQTSTTTTTTPTTTTSTTTTPATTTSTTTTPTTTTTSTTTTPTTTTTSTTTTPTTTTSTTTRPTTTSTNPTDDFSLMGFHLKTNVDVPDESDLDSVLATVRSRLYSHLSIYYKDLQSQSLHVCRGVNSDKLTVGAELKLPVSAVKSSSVADIVDGVLSLTGETWEVSGEYTSFTVSVGSLTVVADTTSFDVYKAFATCTRVDCDLNDTGVCD